MAIDRATYSNQSDPQHGNGTRHKEDDSMVPTFILFVFCACAIAAMLRTTILKSRVLAPVMYLLLFFIGAVYGVLLYIPKFPKQLNFESVYLMEPYALKCFWLPLILFDAFFAIDIRAFASIMVEAIALGCFEYVFLATLRAMFLWFVFGGFYDWPLWLCILFAAISCVTESTLILELLREAGTFKKLCRLIEGESFALITLSCVIYEFFYDFYMSKQVESIDVISFGRLFVVFVLLKISISPLIGYMAGRVTVMWILNILSDPIIEILVVITNGYLVFVLGTMAPFLSPSIAFAAYLLTLSHRRVCLFHNNDIYLAGVFQILRFMADACICTLAGIQLTRTQVNFFRIRIMDVLVCISLYFQSAFTRGILGLLIILCTRIGKRPLSFQTISTIVWCEVHGSIGLLLAMVTCYTVLIQRTSSSNYDHDFYKLYFHLCGLFVLTAFLNGLTMKWVVKLFGMHHVTVAKRLTMNNALQVLRETVMTTVRTYRADRFLADADWDIVYQYVQLENPYTKRPVSDLSVDNEKLYKDLTHEGKDGKYIDSELSPDSIGLTNDTKKDQLKLFRAKKESVWKQYHHGMVSLDAVRALVESIDEGQDVNVDKSMKYCEMKGITKYAWNLKKSFEVSHEQGRQLNDETWEIVKNMKYRRILFLFQGHRYVRFLMNVVIITNFLFLTVALILMWRCYFNYHLQQFLPYLDAFNTINVFIYSSYVLARLFAFGWGYFKLFRNRMELSILCISVLELILSLCVFSGLMSKVTVWCYSGDTFVTMNPRHKKRLILATAIFSIRYFRTYHLIERSVKVIADFYTAQLQSEMKLGYDIGKGYVTCVEEVHGVVDQIIEEKYVRDVYKEQLSEQRLNKMKELATLQKTFPGIVLSVKCQHAGRRILNNITERINRLRNDGMLDEAESAILERMVASRLKMLLKIPSDLPLPSPTKVLSEIPWVAGKKEFIEYIQHNSTLISMAEGEVLDSDSNPYGGLYIIISGLVRVDLYLPDPNQPPKCRGGSNQQISNFDTSSTSKDQEPCTDYLTQGTTLGTMSLLTACIYKTMATCETAVQLCHFEYEAVQAAIELYVEHPSLEYQLWHTCSMQVAFALLKTRPLYRSLSPEDLKMFIESGKVYVNPWTVVDGGKTDKDALRVDLRHLQRFEFMIIFGTAYAGDGFEVFRGPCIVPQGVDHIIFQPYETDKSVLYMILRDNVLLGSAFAGRIPQGASLLGKDDSGTSGKVLDILMKKSNQGSSTKIGRDMLSNRSSSRNSVAHVAASVSAAAARLTRIDSETQAYSSGRVSPSIASMHSTTGTSVFGRQVD